MILFPAIDLKDGQCVRLLRGEMAQATVFGDDPAAQALKFQQAGCEGLHLFDLNGAFAGQPVNAAAVEAILARISVPAQLGGGIRDMATIEMWLSKGLARVILGTVAVENPALVRDAARAFPGKIAVGIDRPEDVVVGKDGRVFASDHQCAVAEIHPDGSFTRLGPKGGAVFGKPVLQQGGAGLFGADVQKAFHATDLSSAGSVASAASQARKACKGGYHSPTLGQTR